MPSSARSRPHFPGRGPLSHIPGIWVWGPSGPTHSLGRRAAAATAPRGLLASLQAQLATPARGCTGLIKAVRLKSQEPALLLPGKAAAPPPPFPSQPFFLPLPSSLPLSHAPGAHSPRGRGAAWSPGTCGRQAAGGSNTLQVVIFQPPGVWPDYLGFGNPGRGWGTERETLSNSKSVVGSNICV